MALTDPDSSPLPAGLLQHLRRTPRSTVMAQWIDIPAAWWNGHLAARALPGGPVEADEGTTVLTRAAVFALAAQAREEPVPALRLLWHSLAWGAGHRLRLCDKRLDAVAAMGPDTAGALLVAAARLAVTDARGAYQRLNPGGRPAIAYLGPAFSTKFLYFAGGGTPDHPCSILDSRVTFALHHNGWDSLPPHSTKWPPATYERYLQFARRWATLAKDELSRTVAYDEIEYWLFGRGAPMTRGRMSQDRSASTL